MKLTPVQVSAVLRSLVHHTSLFIGGGQPDKSLCKCLAKLLGKHLPDTFRRTGTVVTKISDMFQELEQK